jgi:hypothetical protein
MKKLDRLKYLGYCLSQLPPEDAGPPDFSHFVDYAKFQLCRANHKLMLDPIWEEYTNEEIVVEYYAHLMASSKDQRNAFLQSLAGYDESIYSWLDDQIQKNQKEVDDLLSKTEEKISFSPKSFGE